MGVDTDKFAKELAKEYGKPLLLKLYRKGARVIKVPVVGFGEVHFSIVNLLNAD